LCIFYPERRREVFFDEPRAVTKKTKNKNKKKSDLLLFCGYIPAMAFRTFIN